MAKLVMKSADGAIREFVLVEGLNRIGRSPANEIAIESPTVSAAHCELWLMKERLLLRDLESTNGTFVDGRAVTEVELRPGNRVSVGGWEFVVEQIPGRVAIPLAAEPVPPPPRFTPDGLPCCINHLEAPALFRCSKCGEQFCADCVHLLARRGGSQHAYCPSCHAECVTVIPPRLGTVRVGPARVPAGWLGRLTQTLKLRR